ncbi:hypothetical protein QF031_002151 [Pseudarthrobacter defluvii]|nr:hypothetical protein [Pseudarthrobacter defluvii]
MVRGVKLRRAGLPANSQAPTTIMYRSSGQPLFDRSFTSGRHEQGSRLAPSIGQLGPGTTAQARTLQPQKRIITRQRGNEKHNVAADYDEVRPDVKESQERSLEDVQSVKTPDARSVVTELDEADALDEGLTPGGEIIADELIVQVIPQAADEFTCYSCFLVRQPVPAGAREQRPFILRRVRRLRQNLPCLRSRNRSLGAPFGASLTKYPLSAL